jgi:transcriptional regulator with PAS, ATPase and Fis domain
METSPLCAQECILIAPGTKLDEIEKIVILETLKRKQNNRTHSARALGIGIRTLQRKLKQYGSVEVGEFAHGA